MKCMTLYPIMQTNRFWYFSVVHNKKSLRNLKLRLALRKSVLSSAGCISVVCKQYCCKFSWFQHYPSLKVIVLSIFVTKVKHSHFRRNPGEMGRGMVLFVICFSMSLKPIGMEMKSTVYTILCITSVPLCPFSREVTGSIWNINNIHVSGSALLLQIKSPGTSFCAETEWWWTGYFLDLVSHFPWYWGKWCRAMLVLVQVLFKWFFWSCCCLKPFQWF